MAKLFSTWISTENAWNSSINNPPELPSVQVSGFAAIWAASTSGYINGRAD
jgi:hypothetical protein